MTDTAWINVLITYAVVSGCALVAIGKYCYRMGKRMGAVEKITEPFATLKAFRDLHSSSNGQHKQAS